MIELRLPVRTIEVTVDGESVCTVPIDESFTHKGMPIAVKDLTHTVQSNKDRKATVILLNNITAAFEPAKMTALMGASGSGKTTLLDVLAGRNTAGVTKGTVLYSSRKASKNFLRRYTGYVEQFDTMLDTLTVKEMLMYTAELKRPHTESYAEKEQAVDYFIKRLALNGCKDTRIGNSLFKGISGGQSKRTSIAMAMVTRPSVLLLDEPTSGLDSFTANEAMSLVQHLANSEGVTIVATIHSPSPYTFELFDSLVMLLSGEVVYAGPNDDSMLEYFQGGCGILPKTTTDAAHIHNPAEFLTDLIVGASQRSQGQDYAAAYQESAAKRATNRKVMSMLKVDPMKIPSEVKKALNTKRATVTPFWWALKTIIKYRTFHNYKSLHYLTPRIGDKVMFSLLMMGLYWNVGADYSQNNLSNIHAMLFMWTVLPAFGAASYVPSIVLERPLFVRERNDGLYSVMTYLMSKVVDELFLATVASVLFAAIVYYPLALRGDFVFFWLIYLEVLSIGIMLAYLIATLAPNMDVANTALPAYVITLLFFAGMLMRFVDIPSYLTWYSKIDFMRYSWGGLMVNEFRGRDPDWVNGQTVLQMFGLTDVDVGACVVYLLLFFFSFFGLTYIALSYRNFGSR